MATKLKFAPEAPRLSPDNYLSRDFALGEKEHLWPRVFSYARPNPHQEAELTNFHRTLETYVLGQARP